MSFQSESERLPTLEALERELVARVDTRLAPPYPRAALATALMAIVVAVMTLTPFGRALADQIADWIGIGDPPTREQRHPVGEPAVVVGVGEVGGERFELVVSAEPQIFGGSVPGRAPTACFSIDFPDWRGPQAGECLTDDAVGDVRRQGITGSGDADFGVPLAGHPLSIAGLVDPGASRVEISSPSTGATTEASIGRLTPELASQIGIAADLPAAYFAFPPDGGDESLIARAFAEDGSLLAEQRLVVHSTAVPPEAE